MGKGSGKREFSRGGSTETARCQKILWMQNFVRLPPLRASRHLSSAEESREAGLRFVTKDDSL